MDRKAQALTLILTFSSLLSLVAIEPVTAYYISSSLRITSPISTVAYDNPIDFSVYISDRGLLDWGGIDTIGTFTVLWVGYSLDDNSIVTIMEVELDENCTLWGGKEPPVIASQSISGIPEGQHKIVAFARGYFTGQVGVYEYKIASDPTYFTIGDTVIPPPTPTPTAEPKTTSEPTITPSPTPEPTPTEDPQQPEQDMTAGAILAVTSIIIFLSLLIYLVKRK